MLLWEEDQFYPGNQDRAPGRIPRSLVGTSSLSLSALLVEVPAETDPENTPEVSSASFPSCLISQTPAFSMAPGNVILF